VRTAAKARPVPRRPPRPSGLAGVRLRWYPLALLPLLLLIGLPILGVAPLLLLPLGLFLLFFWIFSLGFAIYARSRKSPHPPQPRSGEDAQTNSSARQ